MIERKIIIGLITSTEYLKKIRPVWNSMLIESSTARILANWAIEYYDKYGIAANKEMETIFFQKAKDGLDKDIAAEIEEDILPDLSEESVDEDFNLDYLFDESIAYFKSRQLMQLSEQMSALLTNGQGSFTDRLRQAEELRVSFKPVQEIEDLSIEMSSDKALHAIRKAFKEASEPIVKFPKQLGEFWNAQFVPGAFISLLAPEKRGKTFWLLEIAMRANRQRNKVVFFQAGDMNEAEQLKRIGVYLTKRSNLERYCGQHYEVVRDCIRQQTDSCNKSERECSCSAFETPQTADAIKLLELKDLIKAYEYAEDYRPCYNCKDYNLHKLGTPWLNKVEKVDPIDSIDVERAIKEFFHKNQRRFKLSTHANGTLSVKMIEQQLDTWQDVDGFIPDIIIIDYADLLVPSISLEFRHQQNQIWKDLRKLSQTKRGDILPLVIAPTQADAAAYKAYTLRLSNFSEDKRKYAHVTAMYGLNQDPLGREKSLGITRINEIIVREGDYSVHNQVTVLQNLRKGRPLLGSYWGD
jgi:hypothetical protein